jgi:hypothetical protein
MNLLYTYIYADGWTVCNSFYDEESDVARSPHLERGRKGQLMCVMGQKETIGSRARLVRHCAVLPRIIL